MKNLVCDPELFEEDLSGPVTIVTGANSGTGLATVQQLVKHRRVAAGQESVASLLGERSCARVSLRDQRQISLPPNRNGYFSVSKRIGA